MALIANDNHKRRSEKVRRQVTRSYNLTIDSDPENNSTQGSPEILPIAPRNRKRVEIRRPVPHLPLKVQAKTNVPQELMASPPRLEEEHPNHTTSAEEEDPVLWEETEDGEDSETGGDKVLVPVTLPKERKETV